jgi:hypothetical protein
MEFQVGVGGVVYSQSSEAAKDKFNCKNICRYTTK